MPLVNPLIFKASLVLAWGQAQHFLVSGAELWISDPEILEARASHGGVHLIPRREKGLAFVSGLKLPEITPSPIRTLITSKTNFEALNRCPRIEGVDFSESGELVWSGSGEAFEIAQKHCKFESLALSPYSSIKNEAHWQRLLKHLKDQGMRVLQNRWIEGRLQLLIRGGGRSLTDLQAALGLWAPFFDIRTVDTPNPGRSLIFEVTLFELSKSKARSLGIQWPRELKFRVSPQGLVSGNSMKQEFLDLGIDFGESLGIGRILAQPILRTLPGEKASFQNGGELPIEFKTEKEISTQWKNYGLLLELTPEKSLLPGSPEISVDFQVELSEPDLSSSNGGKAGFLKRQLKSRFDLRIDETTVLTSMNHSRTSASREGITGLLSLPLLRHLFSNKSSLGTDSTLWFGIKPTWEGLNKYATPQMEQDGIQEL